MFPSASLPLRDPLRPRSPQQIAPRNSLLRLGPINRLSTSGSWKGFGKKGLWTGSTAKASKCDIRAWRPCQATGTVWQVPGETLPSSRLHQHFPYDPKHHFPPLSPSVQKA